MEKPYLKSGVNVADVANRLSSNKTYLSRLLNDKLNLNFNQFVNTYRVKEAQKIVAEEGSLTLPELCKRAGFTSMASFTVAFKLNTGMTPGEWCKKQKRLL
jgi:AraC-like DNA-binding protein